MLFILPSVPPPNVEIISLRPEPLYAGTTLTVSCTVSVDDSVNNNEMVVMEWNTSQGSQTVGTAVRVSNNSYESNLTIDPLAKEESTIFSCMGIIIGGSSSATDTSNITIQVIGKYSILSEMHCLKSFFFFRPPRPKCNSFKCHCWSGW